MKKELMICGIAILCTEGVNCLVAAKIEGTVIIKRRLTKPRVTAPVNLYDRGASVALHPTQETDFLAFERSRVVIYLDGELSSKPTTAVMEQKHRQFLPDTITIPAGSTVSFPNRDLIFHNVFSLSKPKTFDLGNYPRNQTRNVTFPKPGIVFVNCRLHPNMTAVIVITPNQWCTKADAAGRFVIPDVPPGRYVAVAWHRTAGFFRQFIRVTQAGASDIQFQIPVDDDGAIRTASQR